MGTRELEFEERSSDPVSRDLPRPKSGKHGFADPDLFWINPRKVTPGMKWVIAESFRASGGGANGRW
jgi:hypothetical protein